jgi:hypothetical protein
MRQKEKKKDKINNNNDNSGSSWSNKRMIRLETTAVITAASAIKTMKTTQALTFLSCAGVRLKRRGL